MQTLRYIDFNRNSQFRLWRQQSDGRRIQENATLWEWIYHAFEILNMTTIRTHWNHGFIGMIRLHVTCILNEGNYAKLKRLPFNQQNARTEKTKIEKSVEKSLTTDFSCITAEKRKNRKINQQSKNRQRKFIFITNATETNRFLSGLRL